jgi:hypothetical protein
LSAGRRHFLYLHYLHYLFRELEGKAGEAVCGCCGVAARDPRRGEIEKKVVQVEKVEEAPPPQGFLGALPRL